MAVLIDGNNLIGHLFTDSGIRDPGNRSRLIGRLLLYQRITKMKIILVFDGPPPAAANRFEVNKRFAVFFPEPGEDADIIIKNRIIKQVDKRHFFVVSSDREIRDFARSHGLSDMTCQEFGRALKKAHKRHREDNEMAKIHESPSPLEVRLWNEVFRVKK